MIQIKLDEYEILAAGTTALLRITESMRQNIEWGHGYKGTFGDKVAKSLSGTLAELAVAKCLKVHFNYHVNNFKGADLYFQNQRVQVRCQVPKENNFLIIRQDSSANELYVLVIDRCPLFNIIGFVNSSDVIGKTEYLTDFGFSNRPKVYSVPFFDLIPIENIFNGKQI
jgi:hypothetical protein